MRIYVAGMILKPLYGKYSCVKLDLFHIAVSKHVMFSTK